MRRPAVGRSSVATSRSRLDLPLPLGPVNTSAPPAGRRQSSPANTSRSPRRQARFSPTSSAVSGKGLNRAADKKSGSGGGEPEPHGRRPRESAGGEGWGTNL